MNTGIALTLIIIGIILVFAELFLLTGMTVAGVAGIAATLGGIYFLGESLAQRALIFVIVALVVGLICFVGYQTGHLKRAWGKVSLEVDQRNEKGYVAPNPEYERYVRKRGEALTVLRPAGVALIDGERVDVVTAGEYIKQGTPILVTQVEGVRIIVREAGGDTDIPTAGENHGEADRTEATHDGGTPLDDTK